MQELHSEPGFSASTIERPPTMSVNGLSFSANPQTRDQTSQLPSIAVGAQRVLPPRSAVRRSSLAFRRAFEASRRSTRLRSSNKMSLQLPRIDEELMAVEQQGTMFRGHDNDSVARKEPLTVVFGDARPSTAITTEDRLSMRLLQKRLESFRPDVANGSPQFRKEAHLPRENSLKGCLLTSTFDPLTSLPVVDVSRSTNKKSSFVLPVPIWKRSLTFIRTEVNDALRISGISQRDPTQGDRSLYLPNYVAPSFSRHSSVKALGRQMILRPDATGLSTISPSAILRNSKNIGKHFLN